MDHVAVAAGTVCEIGPVQVRRLCSGGAESVRPDSVLAAAALDGDDPLVLIGARPMAVDEVWSGLLEPLLRADEPALLVHPSWWPGPRIDTVREVARRYAGNVITRPRSWLLTAIDSAAPVVEIGPRIVVVSVHGAAVSGIQRRARAPAEIANSVVMNLLQESGRGSVWLDAPAGVAGADALGDQIADRLRVAGRSVQRVDDRHLLRAAARVTIRADEPSAPPRRRRHRLLVAATAAAAVATAAGIGFSSGGDADIPAAATTALVEGQVAIQIPRGWAVRRLTTGPGSVRVEAISPDDAEAVLHLTQAAVPEDSLATAATTLRRAIDAEPAGIFVDFHPADERAGRPAITYREIRPGHEIRWAVVLDGNMRIGIGCQRGAASADLTAVCDKAVRSAREIG